jgi:hypothetical protein
MLSLGPPWSSGCTQLAWKCWDRGRGSVFKGPFNPVLAHAIGIRGDTECYISSGGPVLVLDRSSETL